MKQTNELSISLKREKNIKQNSLVLIPACFLLTFGFWGVLFQEWKLEEAGAAFLPVAALSLLLALACLFLKEKREDLYFPVLVLFLAAALVMVFIFREGFSGSLGTLLNQIRQWFYLRTGYYSNAFLDNGNPWPVLILLAILSGILTQLMVLYLRGHLVIITALVFYILLASGAFRFSLYGLLLLLGCILTLAQGADGRATAGLWIIGGFTLMGALVLGICALFHLKGADGSAGDHLMALLHKNKYETTETALPEGDLKDLGKYSPSEAASLSVTMDTWGTLYLRGFQGGSYTGTSWECLSPEETEEEKDLLDGLQKEGFYASTQLSEGWKALGEEAENSISVTNQGACSAYNYLPYGGGEIENLDPDSITGEGLDSNNTAAYSTELYPVEDSYLLMQQLTESEEGRVQNYLSKESAYRDFVYEHYLTIPDQVYSLLTSHKLLGTSGIATTQACREVQLLLKEKLQYSEGTQFYNHDMDFLDYLLNIQPTGYSVHYATLAVMMLRSYGIPARYVEGYYIPSSLTADLEGGDCFTVTEKEASAWVEYYADGVGWLLFDPVPGHKDTCKYNLPVGQGDADAQVGNVGLSAENRQQQQKQEDENTNDGTEDQSETDKTGIRPLFVIFLILLSLLAVALVLLIIRTILLRRRMRKQREAFKDPDPRVATAAILCSLRRLTTGSLSISEEAFFRNPDHMVSELLEMPEEDLQHWKTIADEIQFSRHPISEETRSQAVEWLRKTEESWNKAVPLPRKLLQKYILCKVY